MEYGIWNNVPDKLVWPITVLLLVTLSAGPLLIPSNASATTVTSFTSTGYTTWTVPAGVTKVDVLIVGGGGGGGGRYMGGGGGAGGYRYLTNQTVTPGAVMNIRVGAGGAGGSGEGVAGSQGQDSAWGTATSTGGGGGNGYNVGSPTTGGSGGGASGYTGSGAAGNTPSVTPAQGYSGGNGATYGAGGGGGAGGAGANGTSVNGGAGGVGVSNSITGSATYYAGGGGGAAYTGTGGAGGNGGGGAGVSYNVSAAGTPGTANTGGGGGGANGYAGGASVAGGDGGSGIVIIKAYGFGEHGEITLSGNVKFAGNLTIVGALSKGAGTFVIDHPLAPLSKLLYHSFVESPDVKNLYDGVATLDENGEATIKLPDYFEALNKDFRYQFFPLYAAMPDLYIKKEVKNNEFVIAGGKPGGQVSWQITGTRHDAYILAHPVIVEVLKTSTTEVKRGTCLWEPLCR